MIRFTKLWPGLKKNHVLRVTLLLLISLQCNNAFTADGDSTGTNDATYQEIKWVDLIPLADFTALLTPPKDLDRIADGSAEDSLDNIATLTSKSESANSAYWKALQSTRVIAEFNNKKIRIPGFVVPIESNEDQHTTSFFLVPYFGACIHLPPPPPNQIIYAKYSEGFQLDSLNDTFWVEGTIKTEVVDTLLGTSAYTMQIDSIREFIE